MRKSKAAISDGVVEEQIRGRFKDSVKENKHSYCRGMDVSYDLSDTNLSFFSIVNRSARETKQNRLHRKSRIFSFERLKTYAI